LQKTTNRFWVELKGLPKQNSLLHFIKVDIFEA
jgi:hypothetical protein